MRLLVSSTLATLALGAALLVPRPAHAGIASCGNINVEAQARCEAVAKGPECEGRCTNLEFQAACSGKLEVQCEGMCTASASASCTTECEASCTGRCQVNPGKFDCSADCNLQADAECSGQCSASANRGQCEASCKATFSSECKAACTGTPPSAECNAKCQASCEGNCTAQANVDCQVSCQSRGFAQCEADLKGQCTFDCTEGEGALICDSSYVDHGNNLQECINALKAEVNASVTGSASCSGNSCEAEGSASCECGLSKGQAAGGSALLWSAGALGMLAAWRRRRRVLSR
jgi:MYXO-CTERM domain-containing protein